MKKDQLKTRIFRDKNYKAIWLNGKTIRLALDPLKPILELDYPEFYDIKITDYCQGNCPWCYQNSTSKKKHFNNIIGKTVKIFGKMTSNEKPFQVAIGGGNPNQHPDFIKLLNILNKLDITPNYTTNGMGLTKEVLEATKKYCGGVAVSLHPHLNNVWSKALCDLYFADIKTNAHLIISDKESIDYFAQNYKCWKHLVEYFVLLPYEAQGRAPKKSIDYKFLLQTLDRLGTEKLAFGANFYPFLKTTGSHLGVSLYEPEIMSKYIDLNDMKCYKSSFNLTEDKQF